VVSVEPEPRTCSFFEYDDPVGPTPTAAPTNVLVVVILVLPGSPTRVTEPSVEWVNLKVGDVTMPPSVTSISAHCAKQRSPCDTNSPSLPRSTLPRPIQFGPGLAFVEVEVL